jgi:hypothetical protein
VIRNEPLASGVRVAVIISAYRKNAIKPPTRP